MSILDRLLGKKKRTPAIVDAEIAAQTAILAEARHRVDEHRQAREAALDALDKVALKAADDARTDAGWDIEIAERVIAALESEKIKALDAQAREALRAEIAAYSTDADNLAERLVAAYPKAAGTINEIVHGLIALEARRRKLEGRAREIGEPAKLRNPEDVRQNAPVRWSAYWPNPNGHGVIKGPAEDAPDGCIRWEGGRPMAIGDDVRLEAVFPPLLPSLIYDLGNIPGLHGGFLHGAIERPAPRVHRPEWGRE